MTELYDGITSLHGIHERILNSVSLIIFQNTKNYIGFIVCVAVGVLFVVAMPIAGLILFCCRCCCGNCGANAEDEPEKDNR